MQVVVVIVVIVSEVVLFSPSLSKECMHFGQKEDEKRESSGPEDSNDSNVVSGVKISEGIDKYSESNECREQNIAIEFRSVSCH